MRKTSLSLYQLVPFILSSLCPWHLMSQEINLITQGKDSHIELHWNLSNHPQVFGYQIYRSVDSSGGFSMVKFAGKTETRINDFFGRVDTTLFYQIMAVDIQDSILATSNIGKGITKSMTDEELMTMVQEYTFRYFWEHGHPVSGMARERNTSGDIVTTGGTGFGIMAMLVAVERGFITREQALQRLIRITSFLEFADRFHGAFPHWMQGKTGDVIAFSTYDDGGDLVETAFLIQGLLAARSYFQEDTALENSLRSTITRIWHAVEWDWYARGGPVMYWHWSPIHDWRMNFPLRGFNETMIVYILAIASPTHPVAPSLYKTGWAGGGNYSNTFTYYNIKLSVGGSNYGGPLFFSHYSFLGFDPRKKIDDFVDYFERNRNHALIHWEYCRANPKKYAGYSESSWGLTASDDPFGYLAHEPGNNRDNGTISPTAALASMPYTPMQSMAALKHFYRDLGKELWGNFGFYDAFNLQVNWFADSYLAIDQGPIVCMIENHRTALLWNLFMSNEEIQNAIKSAGFISTAARRTHHTPGLRIYPNPVFENTAITIEALQGNIKSIEIWDNSAHRLFTTYESGQHSHKAYFQLPSLPGGVYWIIVHMDNKRYLERLLILKP